MIAMIKHVFQRRERSAEIMTAMVKRFFQGDGATLSEEGDQVRRERSERIVTALRIEQHRVNAEEMTIRQRDWFEGTFYPRSNQADHRKGSQE